MEIGGGSGGLSPPILCGMAGLLQNKSADAFVCVWNAPFNFRFVCFVGNFVFFTSPHREKQIRTLAGFANLSLHGNRHLSVSRSADIIWTIPRTGGLKIRVFAPFYDSCCHFILQKPTRARGLCIKASHAKGRLRVISNNADMWPFLLLDIEYAPLYARAIVTLLPHFGKTI